MTFYESGGKPPPHAFFEAKSDTDPEIVLFFLERDRSSCLLGRSAQKISRSASVLCLFGRCSNDSDDAFVICFVSTVAYMHHGI